MKLARIGFSGNTQQVSDGFFERFQISRFLAEVRIDVLERQTFDS